MTEEQIGQKAKNVYIRCFDDDFEYSGVLHALEICAKETAAEATKELVDEKDELQKSLREALLIIEHVYQVPVMQISAHSFPKPKLMSEIEEFLKKNGKL